MYIITILFALAVVTQVNINLYLNSFVLSLTLPKIFILQGDLSENVEQTVKECATEFNVDQNIWNQKSMEALPEEQNIKCFLKCVMMKMGDMDADGTIHKESLVMKFKEEFPDQIEELKKCVEVSVEEPCEIAYTIHKCMAEIL